MFLHYVGIKLLLIRVQMSVKTFNPWFRFLINKLFFFFRELTKDPGSTLSTWPWSWPPWFFIWPIRPRQNSWLNRAQGVEPRPPPSDEEASKCEQQNWKHYQNQQTNPNPFKSCSTYSSSNVLEHSFSSPTDIVQTPSIRIAAFSVFEIEKFHFLVGPSH